jgi:hypothetical protein
LIVALAVLFYASAAAAETPFQLSFAGYQIPKDDDVSGMRLALLYAKNGNVNGLDLGLVTFSESENQSGFSFNMGAGRITGNSSGCACTLVNIHEGEDTGINAAFINMINQIESGANVGFVNITRETSQIDIGGLSMSDKSGVQIGFVNFTNEIESMQIGFLNVAKNGIFPVLPFINLPKK